MCLVVGQVTVGDPKLNSTVLGKALSFGQEFCDLLLIVLIFLFSVPFFFFFFALSVLVANPQLTCGCLRIGCEKPKF